MHLGDPITFYSHWARSSPIGQCEAYNIRINLLEPRSVCHIKKLQNREITNSKIAFFKISGIFSWFHVQVPTEWHLVITWARYGVIGWSNYQTCSTRWDLSIERIKIQIANDLAILIANSRNSRFCNNSVGTSGESKSEEKEMFFTSFPTLLTQTTFAI